MLHLLPIRLLVVTVVASVGLIVLFAVYADFIGRGDMVADAIMVVRWSSFIVAPLATMGYVAWRWIPLVQQLVFPYLGGKWSGRLCYTNDGQPHFKHVDLDVTHSLLSIKIALHSDESTSRTLAVHAERDTDISRDRIYYVFLNERKEGLPGGGERYRGLATMRIEQSDMLKMCGDYFTEQHRSGMLDLQRIRSNPWWMIWR